MVPGDDVRGRQVRARVLDGFPAPFRWSERTGERSYWINAQGAPADGYEAALERLAPDWREHLSASL